MKSSKLKWFIGILIVSAVFYLALQAPGPSLDGIVIISFICSIIVFILWICSDLYNGIKRQQALYERGEHIPWYQERYFVSALAGICLMSLLLFRPTERLGLFVITLMFALWIALQLYARKLDRDQGEDLFHKPEHT